MGEHLIKVDPNENRRWKEEIKSRGEAGNWRGRTEPAKQKDEEKELNQHQTLRTSKPQGLVQQAEGP